LYVYFRHNDKETIMVVMNNDEKETKTVDKNRYDEFLGKYASAKDVVSGLPVTDLSAITVPPKSALILELIKP
jgi:neopullulanase